MYPLRAYEVGARSGGTLNLYTPRNNLMSIITPQIFAAFTLVNIEIHPAPMLGIQEEPEGAQIRNKDPFFCRVFSAYRFIREEGNTGVNAISQDPFF